MAEAYSHQTRVYLTLVLHSGQRTWDCGQTPCLPPSPSLSGLGWDMLPLTFLELPALQLETLNLEA